MSVLYGDLKIKTNRALQLSNTADTHTVSLKAPASQAADFSLVVPGADTANGAWVSDGSGNISIALIANSNISGSAAIAYSKLNLTGSIVNADINASAAIAYSKLNLTGSIVNADINASAAIALTKLAALTNHNRALQSDNSGFISESAVTSTELGYLSGVTSSIQTQLNGKANTALSNLASVAINSSLLPGSDNAVDLGSPTLRFGNSYQRFAGAGSNLTAAAAHYGTLSALAEVFVAGTNSDNDSVVVESVGDSTHSGNASILFSSARSTDGTYANADFLQSGDTIMSVESNSYNGTDVSGSFTTAIRAVAAETHTSATWAAKLQFRTAPTGGANPALRMTLDQSGQMLMETSSGANLLWSTDGAGNIGSSGANRPASIYASSNIQAASQLQVIGNGHLATLQGSGSMSGDTNYTLPAAYPASNGYVLTATTAGVMSWSSPSGASFATNWVTADGTTKTVTHSLGTQDVIVQLYDKATNATIEVDSVVRTDANTVTLTASEAPNASGWRVLIIAA